MNAIFELPRGEKAPGDHRLRIGILAPPFFPIPPVGYGGTERVISMLAEGLVERGHEVTLFAPSDSVTRAKLVSPLKEHAVLGDHSSIAEEVFHVTSAYKEAGSFDVFHDHTGIGPALGAVSDRTPVVHTLHGPWTSAGRRFYNLVHKQVHLVAISRAQQAANASVTYAGMVYNGIDVDMHPLQILKEDFLVFLGRVSPEKRPEIAIEVARRAKRPLVMIVKRSEPAERLYWEAHVAPLLGDDVTVLDEPPHQVKVDLLGRARAMVFPIDWPEPFGLVMAEAMACGTPVIARPLGAAPEVVVDSVTGFLCASIDEMVAAADAAGALSPTECRAHVEENFSAAAMVARYEEVYGAILAGSSAVKDRNRSRGLLELA